MICHVYNSLCSKDLQALLTLASLLCLITSTAIGSSVRESDANEFLSFESRFTYLNQGKSVIALIKHLNHTIHFQVP